MIEFCAMMKCKRHMLASLLVALCLFAMACDTENNKEKNKYSMKLNAGIITNKLEATKQFYTEVLGFGVSFENDFYLLMHTPDGRYEISFLKPNHESQQPLFRPAFAGQGVYLTIEVEEVDKLYQELKAKQVAIAIELRDEPWGDRHFAIVDPNGVGIDMVRYAPNGL